MQIETPSESEFGFANLHLSAHLAVHALISSRLFTDHHTACINLLQDARTK